MRAVWHVYNHLFVVHGTAVINCLLLSSVKLFLKESGPNHHRSRYRIFVYVSDLVFLIELFFCWCFWTKHVFERNNVLFFRRKTGNKFGKNVNCLCSRPNKYQKPNKLLNQQSNKQPITNPNMENDDEPVQTEALAINTRKKVDKGDD